MNDFALSKSAFVNIPGYDEDMTGTNIQFPRVPMASSGALSFTIEKDGTKKPSEFLTGVIICNHDVNSYYSKPLDPDKPIPPDCWSNDGRVGHEAGQTIVCATCERNQFIDGKKECKNKRKIFILPEDSILPYLLVIPPTSLKAWGEYVYSLKSKRLNSKMVVTKIGLKLSGEGGQQYSVCTFTMESILPEAKQKEIIELYDALHVIMKQTKEFVETDDKEEDFIPPMEIEENGDHWENPQLKKETPIEELPVVETLEDILSEADFLREQKMKKQPSEDGDTELQEKDRKLAQMILAKTGYDSKNEEKRHVLCNFLTDVPSTRNWSWENIRKFLSVCANYLKVEKLPTLEATHLVELKRNFDAIVKEVS